MPVNCLEQSTINNNNNTETQSTNTMMIPNNVSYQSSSSSSTSYFNDEIKSSNNNGGQSFDHSDHHYLTIKSTTTAAATTTTATRTDDHNGGDDCTTTLLLTNQEKSTLLNNNNNNNVTECYTMLDGGGGEDVLPPPLLSLPIIPSTAASYHNNHHHNNNHHNNNHQQQPQYPPQQIQLNITIGPGTSLQSQTFPIIYCDQEQLPKNVFGTYLEIIEQPTNRIRYRYRSEKGSHGGLNGANSSQLKKTYPTIKIENYHHTNPVYIRASLATNDDNPRSHVHKLMGRHCNEDGSCTLAITENMTAIFQNLGILFIGKKEVPEILFKRKLLEYRTATSSSSSYSFQGATFDQREKLEERLREESEKEAKDLNLNSVRLCFEAFMLHNDALYPICPVVYSRPIANQKSPDSGELKIVRINRFCGSVTGGDEIYLLCEKVNKKEIRVRFFELNDTDGSQQWEAYGDFNESDVHHQVAIVFRTPPYRKQSITKPCQVFMQLYRQRDGEYSEPRTFIYKPKPTTIKDPSRDMVINHGGDHHDAMDSMNDPVEEEMMIINHNNGSSQNGGIMMSNGNGGVGGLQECVLTRLRMENMPPGFKRKKYVARNPQHHHNPHPHLNHHNPHHPDPMLHHNGGGGGKHSGSPSATSTTSNSTANSLSSDCSASSPSCLSSSSSSSSTSSSPTSIVFASKNGTGIGHYHHDTNHHGIIIKKEFENEINLISYSSPPPPPPSSNYPDPCSMDIQSSINSSSIVPKHSNLAHDDYEHLNPMWTTTTTAAPATPSAESPIMPMIVVNDFCCSQTNNHDHNHNHNDHQNIYLNGNINMSNDCIHFPMMMNNIMQQQQQSSSSLSSSSSSSLMATVTATATTAITSPPPGSYANHHHHHHQIYAVAAPAAADDGHTGGNHNNNNIVSTLYSL